MIFSFFTYYIPVQAGFFSFLKDILIPNEIIIQKKVFNSQTAQLLETIATNDLSQAKGGGGITIIDNDTLLPDSGPLGTMADIENNITQDQISIYVVKEGDNLSQIAKMFGVSINTVIWANDINEGDLIRTGQTLIILPISGIKYIVKKGDTLKSIAKKYKGDVVEIIQFNRLALGQKLAVGEEIVIPNGEYALPKISNSYSSKSIRGTGGPTYIGYYLKPINGGTKSQGLHGYNAVDLASYCRTPVMASASGDVIINRPYGWNAGYGKYLVISHPNNTQTLYAHLNSTIVSTGWHVVKGQIIGYAGSTGRSTGCHLHFEVRGAKNPF